MVIDTSAIIAVILQEPEFEQFVFKIAEADVRLVSAGTYFEASTVLLGRRGSDAEVELDRLIAQTEIEIVPFTASHAKAARQAYSRYGKGHHPAKLNLGDCFAYALAKQRREPLLFKGNDFSQTDVLQA